jgi:hypothetical protein
MISDLRDWEKRDVIKIKKTLSCKIYQVDI